MGGFLQDESFITENEYVLIEERNGVERLAVTTDLVWFYRDIVLDIKLRCLNGLHELYGDELKYNGLRIKVLHMMLQIRHFLNKQNKPPTNT